MRKDLTIKQKNNKDEKNEESVKKSIKHVSMKSQNLLIDVRKTPKIRFF